MFQAKGFTVFILLFVSQLCFGQYDGLNGETKQESTSSTEPSKRKSANDSLISDYEERPSITDHLSMYKAVEFMTNGSQNFLYLSFDPQAGVSLKDRLYLGGGVNLGLDNFTGMGGVFGFSRISINKIFFQAEYRTINTYVREYGKRDWISSPIFLIGYSSDDNMSGWGSIGLAINSEYSRNMPFGAIVYRIGVRF